MTTNNKAKRVDFDSRTKSQYAVMAKYVEDRSRPRTYDSKGNRKPGTPPQSVLNAVSNRTAGVTHDLESLSQLLPDIELASQILVSSILSPKDMGAPNLRFTINRRFKKSELGQKILKVVSDYFTDDYKINDGLSGIAHDILFDKGASIHMVVPESSLDALINGDTAVSMESVRPYIDSTSFSARPIGILGQGLNGAATQRSSDISLESLINQSPGMSAPMTKVGQCEYLHVTDNPNAVKMAQVYDRLRHDRVARALRSTTFTMEARRQKRTMDRKKSEKEKVAVEDMAAYTGKSDREIEQDIFNKRRPETEHTVAIKTSDQTARENYGHPMIQQMPIESVIPAYVPGSPKKHIGYFVLLDQFGHPINTSQMTDHWNDLQAAFQRSTTDSGDTNQISTVLRELQGGQSITSNDTLGDINAATDAFAEIIEADLLERLRNGIGQDSVKIARSNEIYQIMMARMLKKKRTQLLYVPEELMSYMAFYYTKQGVGKSLLEESRILGGIRVLLMFASTMGAIRNSTPQTALGIQLDPEDTDPLSTVEQVREGYLRSLSQQYPLGESDPAQIINFLQTAGVSVFYEGHEGLPNMRVTSDEKSSNVPQIDRELEERLRRQHIMSWGLSPETVDVSANIDFATSLVNSSLLLNKRVALYQRMLESQLADFIRKISRNSGILIDKMVEIVEKEGDREDKEDPDAFVADLIQAIEVELPKPDTVTLETQMESYRQYNDSLDMALDAWMSEDMAIVDAEGDMAPYLREMRQAVKAHYLRRWLRENNVFPELEEMLQTDKDGKPLMKFGEMHSEFMQTVMKFIEDYMEKAREAAAIREKREAEREAKREAKFGEHADGGNDEADVDDALADEGGDDVLDDGIESDEGGDPLNF